MKTNTLKTMLGGAFLAGVLVATAPNASAVLYGFTKLTSNGNPDVGSQLSVDVTVSGGDVSFQFFNNVGISSSIAEIYFDDGFLGLPPVITDSDGGADAVKYVQGASPNELPGANLASPPFVTDIVFNAEADNPAGPRGVSAAGEWVMLTYGLGSFIDFQSVQNALLDGTLRIGLHVISINGGGSDSYINTASPFVTRTPDGGMTLLLLGSAMTGIAAIRRKLA